MIVSWNWLKEYLKLDMPVELLADRLMMSGLNLEEIADVEGDIAIDLEVTSNRPDCLGHLGVAREAGVLFQREFRIPEANPPEIATRADSITSVVIEDLALCPQYTARVLRGVKVGPSPHWLVRRLATVGIRSINNVVDATNYVMLECGQPLHAFDFNKLHGGRIVVRRARAGEKLVSIDQKECELHPEMCIIADADHPVAIAGVMGGLETEISPETTSVLLEVADFASMSIRNTARRLNLHSPSSYRFERGVDQHNLDWASRRCADIILKTAGGELLQGAAVAGAPPSAERPPITLRFSQLRRILGIDILPDDVCRILRELGLTQVAAASADSAQFVPPSWRRDLTREIDLVEEAARIHGYEKIPEDVIVPLAVSARTVRDRVRDRAGEVLVASGFYESVSLTFVDDDLQQLFRPWGDIPVLRVEHSSRRRENILRQTLIPSLLFARRENERHGNFDARLFEIAKGFHKAEPAAAGAEPLFVSLVTEQSFAETKGLLETLAAAHNGAAEVSVVPSVLPEFEPGRGCEVRLNGEPWGVLGELSAETRAKLDLRDPVTVAELRFERLEALFEPAPEYAPVPQFPAMERDLNFVLDEAITWGELSEVVRGAAGSLLEALRFGGQYRGPQIPADKKSYLLAVHYRSAERTLTTQEVDAAQQAVIAACESRLGARLR